MKAERRKWFEEWERKQKEKEQGLASQPTEKPSTATENPSVATPTITEEVLIKKPALQPVKVRLQQWESQKAAPEPAPIKHNSSFHAHSKSEMPALHKAEDTPVEAAGTTQVKVLATNPKPAPDNVQQLSQLPVVDTTVKTEPSTQQVEPAKKQPEPDTKKPEPDTKKPEPDTKKPEPVVKPSEPETTPTAVVENPVPSIQVEASKPPQPKREDNPEEEKLIEEEMRKLMDVTRRSSFTSRPVGAPLRTKP